MNVAYLQAIIKILNEIISTNAAPIIRIIVIVIIMTIIIIVIICLSLSDLRWLEA